MLRRVLLSALMALALAPAAQAADPIMPLTQVRPGMQCVGLSVVRGTAISQFNVEVIDVIGAQAGLSGPRILVRASGPAVDTTGIGPGFSGSPILCPGAGGVRANAGAISESIGEYGNHVVLVTPIEEMLRDPPATPPATSGRAGSELARSALPLGILTVSGLSPRTRGLLARAAQRAGTAVLAAPAGPLGGFPRQALVPGASVAATLSTGDIALGAVGTVTYRDGPRIWAFGHAFEGLGRRALFLEDAYVFSVVSNPVTLPDFGAGTYKLTSAGGHVQGTVSSDAVASIAGTVGALPAGIPLEVVARETGGEGRVVKLDSQLADERTLGFGAGLSFAAPLGASQALEQLLRNFGPATVSMCFRIKLAGRAKKLGYCNPYFDAFTPLDDLIAASSLVDAFDLPPPRIERASVSIRARRGIKSDVLISARAPRRVVAGKRMRVRVTLQRRSGGRRTLRVPVRIPRDLRPGPRTLLLSGTSDGSGSAEESFLLAFSEVFDDFGGGSEPRTTGELARRIAAVHQDEGISVRIRRGDRRLGHRSDDVSFEGRLRVRLVVRRARR